MSEHDSLGHAGGAGAVGQDTDRVRGRGGGRVHQVSGVLEERGEGEAGGGYRGSGEDDLDVQGAYGLLYLQKKTMKVDNEISP